MRRRRGEGRWVETHPTKFRSTEREDVAMPHPATEPWVGLLSIGLAFGGTLAVLAMYVVGTLLAARLGMRRYPNRVALRIGLAVAAPLTVCAMFLVIPLLEIPAIVATYGWDAYATGVHIVDKHGLVSNGEYLGTFWTAAIGGLIFPPWLLALTPAYLWYETFREPDEKMPRMEWKRKPGPTPG
jgi:hypothetical protein